MCLIIFTRNAKTATIRKAILERAFEKNGDGAGMAYVHDGVVVISKAFMSFVDFYPAYQAGREAAGSGPFLIHFRYGTCGLNNRTNTQPLVIREGKLVMAHNGTFDSLTPDVMTSDLSDSVMMARLVRRTNWPFPFSVAHTAVLKALCHDSSKLVFLDATGRHQIINESLGKWVRGCWYSDGGTIFKRFKVWTPADIQAYADSPGVDDDISLYDHDDFSIGSPFTKTTYGQKAATPPKRSVLGIGLEQKKSILASSLGYKSFDQIDPDVLKTSDWQAWRILKVTSNLTS